MSISARLAELGIELPEVVAPLAAYTPAIRHGDLVFTSGQLPVVGGELQSAGKVGAEISPEYGYDLARLCALNGVAAAAHIAGDVDHLSGVVKVVGFVNSAPDFSGQPGVINGASEALQEIFGDAGVHARSAVGVAALPLDAPVEVEFIFSLS